MHQLVLAALTITCSKAISASLVLRRVLLDLPHLSGAIPVLAITFSAVEIVLYAINLVLHALHLGLTVANHVELATI